MKNSYVFVLSFLTFFIGYSLFSMLQEASDTKKEAIAKNQQIKNIGVEPPIASEIMIDILQSLPSP